MRAHLDLTITLTAACVPVAYSPVTRHVLAVYSLVTRHILAVYSPGTELAAMPATWAPRLNPIR